MNIYRDNINLLKILEKVFGTTSYKKIVIVYNCYVYGGVGHVLKYSQLLHSYNYQISVDCRLNLFKKISYLFVLKSLDCNWGTAFFAINSSSEDKEGVSGSESGGSDYEDDDEN